jgi:hypothetical protein
MIFLHSAGAQETIQDFQLPLLTILTLGSQKLAWRTPSQLILLMLRFKHINPTLYFRALTGKVSRPM